MAVNQPVRTGTPVRDLQEMLRLISHVRQELPLLSPDGTFGESTLEAVMQFQRLMGLPVTGQVDQTTWDAIFDEHHRVHRQLSPPRSASLFPHHGDPIYPGQSSPLLYPIQGMFFALAPVFAPVQAIPVTGILDSGTASNLRWVQRSGHRQETGALDRETWELLSRIYETFVTRQPPLL